MFWALSEVVILKHFKQVLPNDVKVIKRLPEHKPDVTKVGLGKVMGISIMTSDSKCFLPT